MIPRGSSTVQQSADMGPTSLPERCQNSKLETSYLCRTRKHPQLQATYVTKVPNRRTAAGPYTYTGRQIQPDQAKESRKSSGSSTRHPLAPGWQVLQHTPPTPGNILPTIVTRTPRTHEQAKTGWLIPKRESQKKEYLTPRPKNTTPRSRLRARENHWGTNNREPSNPTLQRPQRQKNRKQRSQKSKSKVILHLSQPNHTN